MNKKGFTLIELMIVIAIIGILAAVAIPKVAQLAACSNGPHSQKCMQLKQRLQQTSSAPSTSSSVQEVNSQTIVYDGHVYHKAD